MKKLIITLFMLLSIATMAMASEGGNAGKVTFISTYENYGGGDVIFCTNNNGSGISGFWLNPQDAGFKQTLAILMLAKATGSDIRVYYDTVKWYGSNGVFYKVYCIDIL